MLYRKLFSGTQTISPCIVIPSPFVLYIKAITLAQYILFVLIRWNEPIKLQGLQVFILCFKVLFMYFH